MNGKKGIASTNNLSDESINLRKSETVASFLEPDKPWSSKENLINDLNINCDMKHKRVYY